MKVNSLKLRILAVVFAMVGAFGTAQAAEFESSVQGQSLTAKEQKKLNRCTLRGYKAFIDANCCWLGGGDDSFFPDYDEDSDWIFPFTPIFYVSTVHGYQFNNFFFLGGGVEFGGFLDENLFTMPIFVDAKVNFINNNRISPYLDSRVGSFVGRVYGFYFSETIGIRIGLGKRNAINVGFEWLFHRSWKSSNPGQYGAGGLKVGYEF